MRKYYLKFANLFWLIAIVCGFHLMFTRPSYAQEQKQAVPDSLKKKVEVELQQKQEDVKIFLDKIEILGRIEKPQTVFIIPGNDPIVEGIQVDRSFFKQIFRAIELDDLRKRAQKSIR
ncbi:MAG: hypothetical protein ACE5HX_09325 [bacterium]